jgi:NAD(P)-dependent dehydrogenase (short-subunit alcohol dehydrogenase family)
MPTPPETAPPTIPPPGWTSAGLDLGGRRWLVTGASNGIGAALARAAGARGARLVLCGRHVPRLEAVHDAIVADGGPPPGLCPLDLERATADDYLALAEAVAADEDALDALVHCAALLGPLGVIERCDPLTWAKVHQVNLHAPFLLTRALLPLLRAAPAGRIVFTSCGMAREPKAYWGAYATSKAGVDALAGTLAAELGPDSRLRCHALDPAPRATASRRQAYPGESPASLGPLAEAVDAYLWLLAGAVPAGTPVRQRAATSGKH